MRSKPNDPVTIRYIASLFGAVGTDVVVTLDVHNPAAFENAFRRPTVALTAAPLFVDYTRTLSEDRLCVVSPDPGGVKRAELFREALETAIGKPVGKAFADKHRSAGVVTGNLFVGDAAGATALVIDEQLLRAFQHGAGRRDLVIGTRRRRLNIDNDRMFDIDQIVEAVAEQHALVGLGGPGG